MENEYISTALYNDVAIDSRYLSLAVEFYQLPRRQAEKLVEEVVFWILKLCPKEQFVSVHRRHNGRTASLEKVLAELHDSPTDPLYWIYSFEAYATSNVVYNKTALDAYTRSLKYGAPSINAMKLNPFSASIDYPQYWENLFSVEVENESQLKKRFLTLLRERGKVSKHILLGSDIDATISIAPYKKSQGLHYGSMQINFSAFCLGRNLKTVAQKFSIFAEGLSSQYCNLNARVMLQPKCTMQGSPYTLYFGSDGSVDDSHIERGYTEREWYSSYYLQGIEWFNIISPLARGHLPCLRKEGGVPRGVCIKYLPCGSVVVKSDAPIDEYNVNHALSLKQFLYSALYPGRRVLPLKLLFGNPKGGTQPVPYIRKNWEIVPVFEDELDIVSGYLVFAYSGDRNIWDGDEVPALLLPKTNI